MKLASAFCLLLYAGISETLSRREEDAVKKLWMSAVNLMHDSESRIRALMSIKLRSLKSIEFEVGYLTFIIQEKYRKMVDKYNVCAYMRQGLVLMEIVLYLEEIENDYWTIEHICNMLHEIERKYKKFQGEDNIKDMQHISQTETTTTVQTTTTKTKKVTWTKTTRTKKPRKPGKVVKVRREKDILAHWTTTTKKFSRWWWPLEYGWEITNYDW